MAGRARELSGRLRRLRAGGGGGRGDGAPSSEQQDGALGLRESTLRRFMTGSDTQANKQTGKEAPVWCVFVFACFQLPCSVTLLVAVGWHLWNMRSQRICNWQLKL